MKSRTLALLLLAALAAPAGLLAHGGHRHVVGTVQDVSAERLEVKAKDGIVVAIHLTADTKYLRGKEAASAADVKEGTRVVVDTKKAGARTVAVEVRIGVVKASPK